MVIKAKRIYEPAPKKEEQVDLQKIIADAFQSSISKAEKASTGVSMEIERENKIIEKILYRIDDKLKSMKIDKSGVTEDVYNQLSSSLEKFGNSILDIVDSNAQTYLTSEDKDDCISIAETMVNEAVASFGSLIKPFEDKFSRDLEDKANKTHSHDEFVEIMREIEENEEELERAIEQKADKEHKHKIEDVTGLSETLNEFVKSDHKHDEYATLDQLNMVSMSRNRGSGGGGHVIQDNGAVKAQRSNLNFIGATVSDDPDNNATVVTITGGSGSGDVVGPASATDGNIALYDGATGKLIKNSTYSPTSFASALTSDENYVTDTQLVIIGNTSGTNTGDQDLSGLQEKATVISGNTTASNDGLYVVVASATFTDPSPVEGKGYKVIVRNGTATVGGTGYAVAGSEIIRIYHSGAWANYLKTPSSGVNTGDQTTIVGITGTLAEFNTALTGADFATGGGTATGTNTGDQDLSGLLPKAGGTMSGDIILGENTSLQLDGVLSADGKWSGTTITATAGYTQAFGDLVYLDPTDSRREACDANAASGADGDCRGLIGMVVVAGTDGVACTILLQGTIRADANFPTLTVGGPVFASETAGDVVTTAPSTSGAVVRVLGSALTADSMYFNPSGDFIVNV